MGSERRQRPHILTVRLYDHEQAYLDAVVAAQLPAKVTRADAARAIMFDVPLLGRPSCSDSHGAHCTHHHNSLVRGYRDERHRQEIERENATGGYAGDLKIWRENGGKLISFADWLNHSQQPQEPE